MNTVKKGNAFEAKVFDYISDEYIYPSLFSLLEKYINGDKK